MNFRPEIGDEFYLDNVEWYAISNDDWLGPTSPVVITVEDCITINETLKKYKIPEGALQNIPTKDRSAVGYMLKMDKYIDVIIPRGGKNLVKKVQDLSSVPVIGHLEGICHTYIDKDANRLIKLLNKQGLRKSAEEINKSFKKEGTKWVHYK